MKTYRAIRTGGDVALYAEDGLAVRRIEPEPSLKLRNHSPTGFEFGYDGSGLAQLALAILLDHTGRKWASLKLYQDFKKAFIAPATRGELKATGDQIDAWVYEDETRRLAGMCHNCMEYLPDEIYDPVAELCDKCLAEPRARARESR